MYNITLLLFTIHILSEFLMMWYGFPSSSAWDSIKLFLNLSNRIIHKLKLQNIEIRHYGCSVLCNNSMFSI